MCKETTTWHSCGHGSEATVYCWRHRDGGGGDHVDCKSFTQPSTTSKSPCIKCKEIRKLNLQPNPYTSLFSTTGVPAEGAFCDTKIAIAKSARKVRTQTQKIARTIAHPKLLYSKKFPGYGEKSPDFEEKPPAYEEK
jgi:hypothetical protein